jgi:lariat debranching enzyme
VRIAIFGDLHGHWTAFRDELLRLHALAPLDLALQVGDAQPVRDLEDLAYVPVPAHHRKLGTYHQIPDPWPVPTLFIGGNHEPWNVLAPLAGGGSLRPGLDYLGRSGAREVGGVRIVGLSGVFSPRAYDRPRLSWPFPPSQAKDASYYRREDVDRLVRGPSPEILLLHEWPTQLEAARTTDWPKRWATVGIEALGAAVATLRPQFVFCGHMHWPARIQAGPTQVIALDAFGHRPEGAVAILEGEPGRLALVSTGPGWAPPR